MQADTVRNLNRSVEETHTNYMLFRMNIRYVCCIASIFSLLQIHIFLFEAANIMKFRILSKRIHYKTAALIKDIFYRWRG